MLVIYADPDILFIFSKRGINKLSIDLNLNLLQNRVMVSYYFVLYVFMSHSATA